MAYSTRLIFALLATWGAVTVHASTGAPSTITNCATQTDLPQVECEALVALYTSTNGPNWMDSPQNKWNLTQNPCTWTGVFCSSVPGHVTGIERLGKNLVGTIPDLSALSSLDYLDLATNHLSGNIPDLNSFTEMRQLWLDTNHLSGTIPDLSTLSRLEVIALGVNQLSGTIPEVYSANLSVFGVDHNQLSGTVPAGVCKAWYVLGLEYNKLTEEENPCVTARNPNWAATQTVAPSDMHARALSPTTIELRWTPILYTGNYGYYEVLCGMQPGGPYTSSGTTAASGDKSAGGIVVTGLNPGTRYYCVVRTYTPKHGYQQNDLTSLESVEVSASTEALYYRLWLGRLLRP